MSASDNQFPPDNRIEQRMEELRLKAQTLQQSDQLPVAFRVGNDDVTNQAVLQLMVESINSMLAQHSHPALGPDDMDSIKREIRESSKISVPSRCFMTSKE